VTFEVYLGLGSNLGDRLGHLRGARRALEAALGVHVEAASPVYASEAHTLTPDETQPPFLNAVVRLRTSRAPEALLDLTQRLEAEAGRSRERRRWAPRPLDLDLLVAYRRDEASAQPPRPVRRATGRLTLPHPRLGARRFVLRPLADLAPNLHVPPPFDADVLALLARCPDADRPVRTSYGL
jgi:2-amino-4-hydroxy-6-hydroxymethyldihydropteridine diphosphokinase